MDLHDFRTEYSSGRLSRNDLKTDPVLQFEKWFKQLNATDYKDPSSMIVATSDQSGQPNQRYVLLKKFDQSGFVFFTDTSSTKGQEIAVNPQVSLLFPWHIYERQVRIKGVAKHLSVQEADSYFHSRPIQSQLAAASSNQSAEIDSRQQLEKNFEALSTKLEGDVPRPERWGGYIVEPIEFEFWQGGEYRLHDRFRYTKSNQSWTIQRLQP